jgi:hypothetical protein
MLKMINSFTPTNENKYTAILPFMITSNIKIEGIIDDNKYIDVITTMASK